MSVFSRKDTSNEQRDLGMKFGERVRELRHQRSLTQRQLASRLGVTFTYLSKVENGHLGHGDYPSEKFILKLAEALEADEEELLLLADKVPESILRRVL
jgi:transcriptional regulator with XRE-family HTH domain